METRRETADVGGPADTEPDSVCRRSSGRGRAGGAPRPHGRAIFPRRSRGKERCPTWTKGPGGATRIRTPKGPVVVEGRLPPDESACRALAFRAIGIDLGARELTGSDLALHFVLVLPRPRRQVRRDDDVQTVVSRVEALFRPRPGLLEVDVPHLDRLVVRALVAPDRACVARPIQDERIHRSPHRVVVPSVESDRGARLCGTCHSEGHLEDRAWPQIHSDELVVIAHERHRPSAPDRPVGANAAPQDRLASTKAALQTILDDTRAMRSPARRRKSEPWKSSVSARASICLRVQFSSSKPNASGRRPRNIELFAGPMVARSRRRV